MASILDKFKEAPAETKVRDMSKKVKVGIIGTGWIAEAHVKAYQKCPDVEIVALADLVPGKAEAFCETYNVGENVKFYPSHKELVDAGECDAVSVCTYNATHAECTIYALEHGMSVLLEKPMCVTLEEAVAICKAEKASKGLHGTFRSAGGGRTADPFAVHAGSQDHLCQTLCKVRLRSGNG